MEEELKTIRAALNKIERNERSEKMKFRQADISRFELPIVVCDIVDYLQLLLLPNEAAFYTGLETVVSGAALDRFWPINCMRWSKNSGVNFTKA